MASVQELVAAKVKAVLPGNDSEFGPNNWYYRRLVIMVSLAICGIIILAIGLIVVAGIALTAWKVSSAVYDSNLLRLAETLVWVLLTFAGSIIGTYVFAANWDAKDYRKNITEMQARGISTVVESKVTTVGAAVQPAVVTPTVPDAGEQPDDTVAQADPGTTTTIETKTAQGPAG